MCFEPSLFAFNRFTTYMQITTYFLSGSVLAYTPSEVGSNSKHSIYAFLIHIVEIDLGW